jgi:hypothetical protein
MKHLVRETLFSQLCSVTSREEGELCTGELTPYDVEQHKAFSFIKLEASFEWLSRL